MKIVATLISLFSKCPSGRWFWIKHFSYLNHMQSLPRRSNLFEDSSLTTNHTCQISHTIVRNATMSHRVNCFLSQIKTYQRNNHLGIQDQPKNTLEDRCIHSRTRLIHTYIHTHTHIHIYIITLERSVHVIFI